MDRLRIARRLHCLKEIFQILAGTALTRVGKKDLVAMQFSGDLGGWRNKIIFPLCCAKFNTTTRSLRQRQPNPRKNLRKNLSHAPSCTGQRRVSAGASVPSADACAYFRPFLADLLQDSLSVRLFRAYPSSYIRFQQLFLFSDELQCFW